MVNGGATFTPTISAGPFNQRRVAVVSTPSADHGLASNVKQHARAAPARSAGCLGTMARSMGSSSACLNVRLKCTFRRKIDSPKAWFIVYANVGGMSAPVFSELAGRFSGRRRARGASSALASENEYVAIGV